jgi:hypothetical protein
MSNEIRVAVLSADASRFLGFGVYEGLHFSREYAEELARAAEAEAERLETIQPEQWEVHEFDGRTFAMTPTVYREYAAKALAGAPGMALNPRIRLDSGEIVFGHSTWWGPASAFLKSKLAAKFGVSEIPPVPAAPVAQEAAR